LLFVSARVTSSCCSIIQSSTSSVSLSVHIQYCLSFPTRRSSDLRALRARGSRRAHHDLHDPPRHALRRDLLRRGRRQRSGGRARSEEHTSELQSRENLVCRLLLEKKNGQESRGLHQTFLYPSIRN